MRFHLYPFDSSNTRLSPSEVPPNPPLKCPAQGEWHREATKGQGASSVEGCPALIESLPQCQGLQCKREAHEGHDRCPSHAMNRFHGFLHASHSHGAHSWSRTFPPGHYPPEKTANYAVEIEVETIKQYFSSRSWIDETIRC